MPLVSLDDIFLDYGDTKIFRGASLKIDEQERVCLIGRNGAGKSTLMKIMMGQVTPDDGDILVHPDCHISWLEQTLPEALEQTVHEYVTGGLARHRALIDEFEQRSANATDPGELKALESLQRRIDAHGGWNVDQRVEAVSTELGLPSDRKMAVLSGGWRRRVGLARALVSQPDLLLLDEPTNHLDLSTIEWLEDRVRGFRGSVLFVTHDRAFLQRLATRIIEIDRGKLHSWPGTYQNFLFNKEKALLAESRENVLFNKKLAQEETWIRQGIKARRTRNEGRVRALESMREEHTERQTLKPKDKVRISVEEGDQSGRKVITAKNIFYAYPGADEVIGGLSLKVTRGDRIGLVGNNGVGKSTLLKVLLGHMPPDRGTVKLGTNLTVGYFDQLRRELDEEKSLAWTIGDGKDYILINGKQRHVIGYLRGFLFSAKRAQEKVKVLSGGERNRLMLARLFTNATNLLVLDEPTNDLDIETLSVMEQRLREYNGTLIVVSHDREFLDNVVDSILVFEDSSRIEHHIGGYSEWLRHGRQLAQVDHPHANVRVRNKTHKRDRNKPTKLSYKLKLELEGLPKHIEALEQQIEALEQQAQAPDFYDQDFEQIKPVLDELAARQKTLDQAIARWDELESMQRAFTEQ